MFFVLSKLLDVLLSPLCWGLVLVALGVPWRVGRRSGARKRLRRRRSFAFAGLVVLYAFSTEALSNALFRRLEHATVSTYDPAVTYDAVILLGGVGDERVTAETGQPAYNDNVERLVMTHRLLAEGHAGMTIVSGAASEKAFAEYSEARILARQIVAWGIDPSRVLLEEEARNTRENAVYSQRIAKAHGFSRVLVVTSAFHMRRSIECFVAVGMPVDTLAVDYRTTAHAPPWPGALLPRSSSLHTASAALREMFGLHVYRLQGYGKPPR